jgi:hypothetical protein
VKDNLDTPCARNARSLLVCAAAAAARGDADEAARLERAADALGMEGYEYSLAGPRLRLALLRGSLDGVGTLGRKSAGHDITFGLAVHSARLDAFAALGEREHVEEAAPPLLRHGTYLEPFALRALGLVRGDDALVEQALGRFEAMGLDWHAAQTEALRT